MFTSPTGNSFSRRLWCDVIIDAHALVVKQEKEELKEPKEEPKEGPNVVVEGFRRAK